jgi:hypothetical protein
MSESFLILFNSQGSNVINNADRSNVTYFCNWAGCLPKKYKKFRCQFVFKSINYNALLIDNCLLSMDMGRYNVFDGVSMSNSLGCVYPVVLAQNSLITTAASLGVISNSNNITLQAVTNSLSTTATTNSLTVTISTANANIVVGMFVTGGTIPAGTSVAGVNGTTITFSNTCSVTASANLLFYNATTLINVGQSIVGNGIPNNTTVTAINASKSVITISNNASVLQNVSLLFYSASVSFYSSTNNDNNDFFIDYPVNQTVTLSLKTFAGNVPLVVPHYTLFLSLIGVDVKDNVY